MNSIAFFYTIVITIFDELVIFSQPFMQNIVILITKGCRNKPAAFHSIPYLIIRMPHKNSQAYLAYLSAKLYIIIESAAVIGHITYYGKKV